MSQKYEINYKYQPNIFWWQKLLSFPQFHCTIAYVMSNTIVVENIVVVPTVEFRLCIINYSAFHIFTEDIFIRSCICSFFSEIIFHNCACKKENVFFLLISTGLRDFCLYPHFEKNFMTKFSLKDDRTKKDQCVFEWTEHTLTTCMVVE